jgi:glyoxylase-like metal-dependent hydrolase (beta-lactamase superfamily II)
VSDQTWTEPGSYETIPGVYRIPLPLPNDGLRAVNVYAIADGDQVVLVDSGWALEASQQQLSDSLALIGYTLADVREFLVTHIHRDHYTQAIAVRRLFGTKVAVGEGERAGLEMVMRAAETGARGPSTNLQRAGAFSVIAEQEAASYDPGDNWELPDSWLDTGTDLALKTRSLRVIATPGHTRGHVVFYDEGSKALFAGDHVLPHITPSLGVELDPASSPLADYLASLTLIRSLPDATLLPAHGPITASVHERIDALLDHHEKRLSATAAAVEQGADTAYEAARALRWTRRLTHVDDMDRFNRMLAVTETLAHLDVLVARGWLSVTNTADGVAHFSRA